MIFQTSQLLPKTTILAKFIPPTYQKRHCFEFGDPILPDSVEKIITDIQQNNQST